MKTAEQHFEYVGWFGGFTFGAICAALTSWEWAVLVGVGFAVWHGCRYAIKQAEGS